MLDEIVKNLKILCDYKVNDLAVLNILQAKLCYVFSLKDVRFKSIQNVSKARPLAYYCFNFVPSGGVKNLLDSIIDDTLLPFVNDYLKEYNNDRIDKLECEQVMELQNIHDKVELRRKKQEQETEMQKLKSNPLRRNITNATQAKLYNSLEIINEVGNGSIMIYNSEFANYYEDAIFNRDKTKKEFLDMLYNLYDGEYQGTDTVSTARSNLYNIPISCIFLSDYKLLSDNEKLSNNFKSYLARGMARRSFIYFMENENYYKNVKSRKYPSYDEKQEAIDNLKAYSKKIKDIFDNLVMHKEYLFNGEANDRINQYKRNIDITISEFYKYTDKLTANNEILKLDIEHSTWKIIKLAVLYHIIDSCGNGSFVKPSSFEKAVEFFEKTHKCLDLLLNNQVVNDYDNLYSFLVDNRNKWVSKTELRSQKFVAGRDFKSWFDEAMTAISVKIEEKGFAIAQRSIGKRSQGIEIALYEPELYKFRQIEVKDNKVKGELVKLDNKDIEVNTI